MFEGFFSVDETVKSIPVFCSKVERTMKNSERLISLERGSRFEY